MKKATCITRSIALVFAALTLFLLVRNGVLPLNRPDRKRYPVRGVDVSSYQGEINWQVLGAQGISFAFIKATEGSASVDSRFSYNYREAQETNLRIGAYHFFSFDSAGVTQAENFIATVPAIADMLPPVVDVEFYGDKKKNPPRTEDVRTELDALLHALEAHYGRKPILYATGAAYAKYLAGYYDAYDIWIRNVLRSPSLPDAKDWTFWQYTDRERLAGYDGEERFIDMNVFNGSMEDFLQYTNYI